MSEGQQPTPQPIPQPLQPQAVIVAPQTFFEKWKFIITPAVIVLLFMASNKGWLTPAQVEIIRPLVSAQSSQEGDTTTETVTVEKKTEPAKEKPTKLTPTPITPEPKPREVGEDDVDKPRMKLTPEEVKIWADILQQLIDQLNLPAPTPPTPVPPSPPTPPNPVPPQPVPPGPTPQPPSPPSPGTLKIIVSDKLGKPISATTVEAGKWFRVSADGSSGRIRWTVTESPTGHAEVGLSGNGLEYSGTMQVGDWIDFDLYDKDNDSGQRMRLACNHGPQPPTPPKPVVPDDPIEPDQVDPKPPLPPVPVTSFRVIFVRESGVTLPASQAGVPGAKAVRDYLFAKTTREANITGWREYDPQTDATNEQSTIRALWEAVKPKITTVPCIVIEVNGKADILPYPANPAEALATLKQYGG